MKVKRYVGETAQEALQKVKTDLGRDAIILNTRKIKKKGIVGFFSKPLVEVVATIDTDVTNSKKSHNEIKASQPQLKNNNLSADFSSFKNELINNMQAQKNTLLQNGLYGQKPLIDNTDTQTSDNLKYTNPTLKTDTPEMKKPDLIKSEPVRHKQADNADSITEIKNMLNKVYDAVKVDYENNRLSEITKDYLKRLEDKEVDKTIINDIKEDIIEQLSFENQQDEGVVKNALYDILSKYFKDPKPFVNENKRKVMLFIGPTGVGKTTTLAKLAANLVINEKRKVGLITSDTYRIAAVEQLKTYSEILGMPLSIIYSPAEITNAINNHKDKDIVLVDTAGRSHKDQYQLMELKSLLKYSIDFEIYLLMSATTKFSDCMEIIKSYSFLDDYKLLFTKLDETSTLGLLLNIAYITKKPISYITTGQSVPDDIEIADKNKIINCLLGDNQYERSS